jgi:hypothetical protein
MRLLQKTLGDEADAAVLTEGAALAAALAGDA